MDDDDDFFGDGKVGPSTLLKNIVASSEGETKPHNQMYASSANSPSGPSYYGNGARFGASNVPRDYDDLPQTSSGSSTSPEVLSPVARKPPLPPSDTQRLAHSLNISPSYGGSRDDRCKNPELRLDLSNLSLSKSQKKRKRGGKVANGSHLKHHDDRDVTEREYSNEKSKIQNGGKSKITIPTGSAKKKSGSHSKKGQHGLFYDEDDGDSCSTCQSSSSSSVSEVGAGNLSEHSDVTSVSPLNSPPSNPTRNTRNLLSVPTSSAVPRNSPTSPASDDLFQLMKRLIDNVDKEQRIARGRGQQTWNLAQPERAGSTTAWNTVASDMQGRHPTLGEIIQSLSRYNVTKPGKSNSSAAPSVVSGTGSGFTATTTLSHASSRHSRNMMNLEPPRRKHHAAINRDKKQREIAAENLRIFQRLQTVRASPEVSRERQIAEWQRQVGFASGASGGVSRTGLPHHVSFGISPLSGLIASAGRGTKPLRPQSAVAYLHTPSSQASSVTSEQPFRSRTIDGSSRPSSGSVHSRIISTVGAPSSHNRSMRGEIYLEGAEYLAVENTRRKQKKKSRPVSGHL